MSKEYKFDYEAFYQDPEGYSFTKKDIAYLNARELEAYEHKVSMTSGEKRALRRWVASGHSVYEHPDSKYICLYGASPELDFLSVYRMDKELEQELKGKSEAEQEAYLKEYTGYTADEVPEDTEEAKAIRTAFGKTPQPVKDRMRKLKRETFYMWMFITQEGLWEEAREFLEENMDIPLPFEDEF